MASTLIEIKSRTLLPRVDEIEEPLEDPRQELVAKLLEYKRYKDAASMLEEQGRQWQNRFGRLASDLPPRERNPEEEPIHEVELWDLVSAFGRILRERAAAGPSNIRYDDTPIHVYMQRIHADLMKQGRLAMSELFRPYTNRSTLVGLFLATLELVRHHDVQLDQEDLFGEIWILPGEATPESIDVSQIDSYEHAPVNEASRIEAIESPRPKRKRKPKTKETGEQDKDAESGSGS
jgi:segregation and condensation protein A